MATQYLVGWSDEPFNEAQVVLVNANSVAEAQQRFLIYASDKTDWFVESAYGKGVSGTFAEKFWLESEDERLSFAINQEVSISEEEFGKRVSAFFRKNPQHADIYLEYYFGDQDQPSQPFPDEMLIEIWISTVELDEILAIAVDEFDAI
jgi:hypothetical protein